MNIPRKILGATLGLLALLALQSHAMLTYPGLPQLTQQQRFDIPAVFPPHGAICSNDPINFTDPLGLGPENVIQAFRPGDRETPAYQFSGDWTAPASFRSLQLSGQSAVWKTAYEPTLKVAAVSSKVVVGGALVLSGQGWIVAGYGGWMVVNGADEAQALVRGDSTLLDKGVTAIGGDPLIVNAVNDAGQAFVTLAAGLKVGKAGGAPEAAVEATVPVASENSTALVKYDSDFAAKQILGQPNVTSGGRTISGHAADRMVNGGPGRRAMTMTEVDQVLGEGNVIKKIDMNHPRGPTVTIQDTTMPGLPQVVVDQQTGSRIVTVIQPTGTRTKP